MGKLAVYKYVALMMLILQIVVTIFTIIGLFGGNFNPAGNTAKAMTVYVLPLLIAANVILLPYWLIRRRWIIALIPLITVLCCIPYIGTLYQFRSLPSDIPSQTGIKVASYNVALFGRETSGFKAEDILTEMKKQKVDIFCIQEYSDASGDKKVSDSYKEYFPYMAMGKGDMVIYSRYPIRENKTIEFEETNNSAMWADVDIDGTQVRVFNVHMETTGINGTLHQAAKLQKQGFHIEENSVVKAIYGNYMWGMLVRAGQAITVANEKLGSTKSTILCGDFNDVPYSFVYKTLLGNMTDGFKECGSGWMYTFRGKKSVRIDYIFHDKSLKGITYYKQELSYSDHYPVFMKLALD
ncbi:MAG: endonuclease/exonuclease/phosphatase family protein [Prevotella sp.]|nr:endonuclease/exonuclease/phosphatase family protein [Prevotella sp.]